MFSDISSADTGHASAIYNTQRQSGIAINTAIVAARRHRARGLPHAYLAAAIIAGIGTLLAWTLIDNRLASSTMVRGAPRGAADVSDT